MADGRRSENRDAELLRSVFVILSGALAFSIAVLLLWKLRRIVGLVVIAAFFAIILNPLVDAVTRLRIRRSTATTVVFLLGVGAFAAMTYTFVRPVYDAGQSFARDIPGFVERAKNGEGRVGELIKRYHIDEKVAKNAPKLQDALKNAGGPAVRTAQRAASGLLALLTIAVLSFLMLLEAPGIIGAFLGLLSPQRALQVRRIGADAAGAVTGYMAGNLVISLIAGLTTWVFLIIVHVPFAGVLGLWVGFADLLPLVGATIGAIPTIAIAFLHSTGSGIAVLIMYIVYQQIENHLLQPVVMSRTVKLNPLGVLLSALIGVELAGFVGALLAIPFAGAIQVVIRDLWDERMQRLKSVPTVGVDETPITGVPILPPPEDPRATGTA
ncbi:MAG TPA: AI-2E family transporter [Acidimicrobiia bacterium]|nr:AI-2E family transporter [Acidimicrobiia bacterium]